MVGCSFVHCFAACGEVPCHHNHMTEATAHLMAGNGKGKQLLAGDLHPPQEEVPPANSSSDSIG